MKTHKKISKKGQGLPLNTIIIAIIVIVVLVVIILIFSGQIVKFNTGANACNAAGGRCVAAGNCNGNLQHTTNIADAASYCQTNGGGVCCIGLS